MMVNGTGLTPRPIASSRAGRRQDYGGWVFGVNNELKEVQGFAESYGGRFSDDILG